ncbi:MAG: acetate--CoA ligase family protein [Dehalococcoidales bacterium]
MVGRQLIDKVKSEGRKTLTEIEAKELLRQAGIDVTDTMLASSKEEAVSLSMQLGGPVVLKVVSPDVIHKSDVGGVKLGLNTAAQVGAAYDEIMKSVRKQYPEADIRGISVQKMARSGVEIIIGMSTDSQFGPVIMFGLGGIMVEILKDVSFRIVPLAARDAREMIREIKGYPVLEGYRGQEAVDIANLEALILKVSAFIEKHPEVQELDLNPVIAYGDGAVAVDARMMLGDSD